MGSPNNNGDNYAFYIIALKSVSYMWSLDLAGRRPRQGGCDLHTYTNGTH